MTDYCFIFGLTVVRLPEINCILLLLFYFNFKQYKKCYKIKEHELIHSQANKIFVNLVLSLYVFYL